MSFVTPTFLYYQVLTKPAYPTTSFAGQTVIVTGSNVGLGKEAARHFARLGVSKLILAVRNTSAGEAAKADIETTTKCDPSVIEVWNLDLASYDSVKAFAARASDLSRIDVLLENAAVAKMDYTKAEGHELTITVNVISTFLLALLLIPKLKETSKRFNVQPRLTIVSSGVHDSAKFPEQKDPNSFVALDDQSKNGMKERYPVSKLLEVLVCRQIAPKLNGSGVILNYLNPGFCQSELARDAVKIPAMYIFFTVMKFLFARTTEVGSRTLVASAAAGEESHGKYMSEGMIYESMLSPFVKSPEGDAVGKKVWRELSEILEEIQPGVTKNLS